MRPVLPILRAISLTLFCLYLLSLLLFWTDAAVDGARRGLTLVLETLLPSLFPFLVFSELLVTSGAGNALGRIAGAPVKRLFGLSDRGALCVLLGSVCGFPVASATAVSYKKTGAMSARELQRITLFANNPSSGFLIAAVGTGMLGSKRAGIALFVITLAAAALCGVALRALLGRADATGEQEVPPQPKPLGVETFTGSVRRALFTFLQVAALVIFFSSVAAASAALLATFRPPTLLTVLLHGTLELTGGAASATTALPPRVAFLCVAFLASFSGLSVCLQIHTLTDGEGTRIGAYLLAKLAQGLIALTLANAYLLLARPTLTPTESVAAFAPTHAFPTLLALALLSLFCLLLTKKKRHAIQRTL